jgi:tRNA threonylcarbamoyl adenosine modification protein YeaZ
MTRGQAERLMPLLEECLSEAGLAWTDLTALGVGIGPGNFTGIRIAVSAARGLALALDVPAVGVDGFDARETPGTLPGVPAPRAQTYVRLPGQEAKLIHQQEAEALARAHGLTLLAEASPADLAERIATLAAQRYRTVTAPPAPLYLRAADAAPSSDIPPELLDA